MLGALITAVTPANKPSKINTGLEAVVGILFEILANTPKLAIKIVYVKK